MRVLALACAVGLAVSAVAIAAEMKGAGSPQWKMNATVIEACSCPMFCTCYFGSGHPASSHTMDMGSHAEEHFCRFNNAYKVNKGVYNGVKLDGAKFWISGDLGGDFTQGQMDWAVVTFDKATTKTQRDGLVAIVGSLFPVKWNSLTTAVGDINWMATKDEARATLDGGKTAEVALKKGGFGEGGQVPVIHGLQYWAADHNDGFVLMPNTVEAWRTGEKQYEFKGTNGFMMTLDIASKPGAAKGGS